ncbi:alpha-1, 3-mannosyltransferase CMT1 [Colletotrichum karsti]|uniref:Alpha-1, 3-mannosyltransferase CMT1 n=1 Tax=Colletotrichum karsti TaxID=1095194 RepID=A0A9P6LQI9_9PEZI|nr:alpha-1, 3-mannosyltransferase CMT1 [Colletotrichum karsti]KAF9882403.1 alpha-1, 3-mannosyltransferase CMT1 [Colletotrichum karsti]
MGAYVFLARISAICLAFVTLLVGYDLYSGSEYLEVAYRPFRHGYTSIDTNSTDNPNSSGLTTAVDIATTPIPTPTFAIAPPPTETPDGDPEKLESAKKYIKSILDPDDKSLPRLDCPRLDSQRYEYLNPNLSYQKRRFFFALNIRQKVELLPRLMGSIIEAIRFLGVENCALSVVEGNSNDGTYEVFKSLGPEMKRLGIDYHFQRSDLDPGAGERIPRLAELRNLALLPLLQRSKHYASDATVLFLNDVALCAEDILELAHQRLRLGADMTCAMDWTYVGADPTFYDVWISRTIAGDSFFNIPADGNWNSAWNIFWNEPTTQTLFSAHRPFQVFSCWNGAVAITARPLLDRLIRFRAHGEGECFQGEPSLFCKDMWNNGFGKIAVVPSVNLEYSDEAGRKIKAAKGYTSQWATDDEDSKPKLEWKNEPPEKVKCIPSYEKQTWEPWNQGLE